MEEKVFGENKTKGKNQFLKSKKTLIILVVAVVLVATAAVIGGSFLVPKDITGAWKLMVNPEVSSATADEVSEEDKAYYIFDKPDKYGRGEYHTCYKGGVEYYQYQLMFMLNLWQLRQRTAR